MITLSEWLVGIKYQITSGEKYGWSCYGENAYLLDYWDGEVDGVQASIIFDNVTQVVFSAEVFDYSTGHAYRLSNPEYLDEFLKENEAYGVDSHEAYDGVNFTELETTADFLDKLTAIVNHTSYDERVEIPLEFDKETLHTIMLMAHEQDITLNKFIEQTIAQELENLAEQVEK
jgi:hypothetical protein